MPKTKEQMQKEHRQNIDVGGAMNQVSPVIYWYRDGHFESEEEARGAFKLAHQQGLDGMGKSIREWMGLTSEEYSAWYGKDILPSKNPRKRTISGPGISFKTWLKQFEEEDSVFGDIAGDVKRDSLFPSLQDSPEPALLYLRTKGVDPAVRDVLKEAWDEFCADTQLVDTTPASCYLQYFTYEE